MGGANPQGLSAPPLAPVTSQKSAEDCRAGAEQIAQRWGSDLMAPGLIGGSSVHIVVSDRAANHFGGTGGPANLPSL